MIKGNMDGVYTTYDMFWHLLLTQSTQFISYQGT